ncbi:MAG: type II toxin-antitoxin system HicA family toxin [Clostridiales bacterium]|nr:type II toxin-antitoxin system HicA family toxin [Clostridiales bacterium]
MKRTELVRRLRKGGYKIVKGGKHGMAVHPDKPGKIPIPHSSIINDFTAKGILRDAGLPE